ncbi:MAG: hypothetical protein M3Q78_10840 [Acidobacteriota bacterium]|nr:hypothetical protein [Acidobacteriota bacterium]
MEKKVKKIHSDQWLKDLPIQAENPAFKPEEMIVCVKCERKNPPTRLNCFYCGAELEISEMQSQYLKPNLRKLEIWEKEFNLIYQPKLLDETKIAEIAKMLRLEKANLQKMLEANKPLPLARAESEREAHIAQKRLSELGLETVILSDETLAVEKPTHRLRGIEFFDGKLILILFNRDEVVEIEYKDLALVVTGAIFERKVEATEKYNKKGETKILQTSETASDESLIDIYSRQNSIGYRILAKGFDFSSLEAEKEILAKDNLKKLVQKLREVAPSAKFVDDYLQVRKNLANVWEVEQKSDSRGVKREGIGKFNLGNITTVNNLSQFTKYSRLQWHIL